MSPATPEDVANAAAKLRFAIPTGHEDDYLALVGATDKAAEALLDLPDYQPEVDLERFPRLEIHEPATEENKLGGWAWKANIEGTKGGILEGKTVVFKDTICVAQVPLEFGSSQIFQDFIPSVDATVVTRVLEAGGSVRGKATCENFSHGAVSFSGPKSNIQNPYAYGFSTGGSSSGCGALIGSGEIDMGVGGDQGGSIRIPAACCGIVGLKPSFGLVPYTGVLSSESGVDSVGPMSQNVYDAALLLQAIAGYDSIDDRQLGAPLPSCIPKYSDNLRAYRTQTNGSLQGVKVGVLKEGFVDASFDDAVKACVMSAVENFKVLGATVEEVSVPMHLYTSSLTHIINKFASGLTRQGRQVGRRGLYLNEYWSHLLPWTQDRYDNAKYFVTGTAICSEYGWAKYPAAYGRAMNLSRKLRDEYDAVFADFDIIVMPTITQPPRRHVDEGSGPLAWSRATPGIVSNTAASNLTGHPSISIPCGWTPPHPNDIKSEEDKNIKLPCGMMLIGKMFEEQTLLNVADAWERSLDWKAL